MGFATRRARQALAAGLLAQATVFGFAPAPACAADLTPTETRWIQGGLPVLQHARAAGVPLDIVVQPQPAAGEAPLAMAYVEGRCKLVLTMRDNPAAQIMLEAVEPALRDGVLELMAAHELGHCLRHVSGRWQVRPLNYAPYFPIALPDHQRPDYAQMQATRLEEGYADLVGLAWIRHTRPQQYAQLHRWLVREREAELHPESHHDTLAWLALARDGDVLAGGATPFARVVDVWLLGVEQVGATGKATAQLGRLP